MWFALVSPDLLSVLAVLALLVGVPAFVIAVIAVVSGYIRYDAEQRLAALEEDASRSPADGADRPDGENDERR